MRKTVWKTTALLALVLSSAGTGLGRADSAADDRLRQLVQMKLANQVSLHIETLGVRVEDQNVRLAGSVASIGEKLRAERIVGGIVGVGGITNELSVRKSDRSEIAIAQDVQRHLGTRVRFRRTPIQVTVSGTEVTLGGVADRGVDRLDAEEIAANVQGVTQVVNNIQVKTAGAIPDESIRNRVLGVLTNPLTFGLIRNPEVTVEEGTVTLRGTIVREADRLEAERLTLSVPGVSSVVNLLTVAGRS